jgi:hypothetical protein
MVHIPWTDLDKHTRVSTLWHREFLFRTVKEQSQLWEVARVKEDPTYSAKGFDMEGNMDVNFHPAYTINSVTDEEGNPLSPQILAFLEDFNPRAAFFLSLGKREQIAIWSYPTKNPTFVREIGGFFNPHPAGFEMLLLCFPFLYHRFGSAVSFDLLSQLISQLTSPYLRGLPSKVGSQQDPSNCWAGYL